MSHDERSMWDDPAESSALRRLLRAGRDASAHYTDYNVERGVVQHLANLQAGVPLPEWAAGLAAAKGGVPVMAWLAVPFLAATSLMGVWWYGEQVQTHRPVVAGARAISQESSSVAGPLNDDAATAGPTRAGVVRLQPSAASSAAMRAAVFERGEIRSRSNSHTPQPRKLASAADARDTRLAMLSTGIGDGRAAGDDGVVSASAARSVTSTNSIATAPLPASSSVTTQPRAAEAETVAESPKDEPRASATRPQPNAPAPKPVPVIDESRLEREMQMLAVTQRVLAQDPARALRLAHQGEHEFPGSMFSAERKQLALLSLVGLGRVDEARRLGRPFLAAYPNAPWSARLQRALATGRLPAP